MPSFFSRKLIPEKNGLCSKDRYHLNIKVLKHYLKYLQVKFHEKWFGKHSHSQVLVLFRHFLTARVTSPWQQVVSLAKPALSRVDGCGYYKAHHAMI